MSSLNLFIIWPFSLISCLFLLSRLTFISNVESLNFPGNLICGYFDFSSWPICCESVSVFICQRASLPYSNGSILRSRGIWFPSRGEPHTVNRTMVTLIACCIQTDKKKDCELETWNLASNANCQETNPDPFPCKAQHTTLYNPEKKEFYVEEHTNLVTGVEIKYMDPHIFSPSNEFIPIFWFQRSWFHCAWHVVTLHQPKTGST